MLLILKERDLWENSCIQTHLNVKNECSQYYQLITLRSGVVNPTREYYICYGYSYNYIMY